MSDLVRNERTKLLANALDRASTAALVVGVFGPLSTWLYGSQPAVNFALPIVWAYTILWLTAAGTLHLIGRFVLRRLR